MKWTTLTSETVLQNKFITIKKEKCERDDGHIIPEHYIIEKEDSATIVALTENLEFIMARQYRHAAKEISIEPPAGYFNAGEDGTTAIERELLEETGYKAEKVIKLGESFPSIGASNTKTHFFIGLNCKKIAEQNLDANEEIELDIIPISEALKMVEEGEIHSMPAILAIFYAKEYLEKNNLI